MIVLARMKLAVKPRGTQARFGSRRRWPAPSAPDTTPASAAAAWESRPGTSEKSLPFHGCFIETDIVPQPFYRQ